MVIYNPYPKMWLGLYLAFCKSEETGFSKRLEIKRRPSLWKSLPEAQIQTLERRMQQEHPDLFYNRRTGQVEHTA